MKPLEKQASWVSVKQLFATPVDATYGCGEPREPANCVICWGDTTEN